MSNFIEFILITAHQQLFGLAASVDVFTVTGLLIALETNDCQVKLWIFSSLLWVLSQMANPFCVLELIAAV